MAIDYQALVEDLQRKLGDKQTYFIAKEKELEANKKLGRISSRDYEAGRMDLRRVQDEIAELTAEIKQYAT